MWVGVRRTRDAREGANTDDVVHRVTEDFLRHWLRLLGSIGASECPPYPLTPPDTGTVTEEVTAKSVAISFFDGDVLAYYSD